MDELRSRFPDARVVLEQPNINITTSELNAILGYLVGSGADLSKLAVSKPTLDDLFMSLAAEGATS